MLVWRVLLAGLGSPLSVSAASRVLFVGQLYPYKMLHVLAEFPFLLRLL